MLCEESLNGGGWEARALAQVQYFRARAQNRHLSPGRGKSEGGRTTTIEGCGIDST